MREIKFKLWYKPAKQMYIFGPKWGNYGQGGGWVGGVLESDYIKHGRTFAPSNQMQLEPESCEWLQFTGLLDKNGVEIYEGDIVKWFEPLWVIQWGFASWEIIGQTFTYYFTPINHSEMEVIGNIYENPELLLQNEEGSG